MFQFSVSDLFYFVFFQPFLSLFSFSFFLDAAALVLVPESSFQFIFHDVFQILQPQFLDRQPFFHFFECHCFVSEFPLISLCAWSREILNVTFQDYIYECGCTCVHRSQIGNHFSSQCFVSEFPLISLMHGAGKSSM